MRDYVKGELIQQESIVIENKHFVAPVPFWAVWPYETMLVSKRHVETILQFTKNEKQSLPDIMKRLTAKYDNLFEISFGLIFLLPMFSFQL